MLRDTEARKTFDELRKLEEAYRRTLGLTSLEAALEGARARRPG